ncbi:thioredoxin domain-containing protein [Aureimonas populi]|uniref:Thioredoxin domain-containing protein n=1 Tax=Aureimonas populi TaxID=1701758 RepID=A0ABW5CSX6_9HYPH|nr:thioredoxin domain-containing protein [Aureimonas populi]
MTGDNGNRLGNAVSPYLLQHRDNPVHWREWSAETLAEAQALDRPILLSVGYAACHWCHVMAHESFEDEATAAVMNRLFVNVKVDREERPDLDHLYMSALHAIGEQGGWPMTMFLTPRGEPFHGGTYFPKRASHGRPGFVELLEAVGRAWEERRGQLQDGADRISAHLAGFLAGAKAHGALPPAAFEETAGRIARMVDPVLGGMGGAPKFPNAPYFEILARSAFPTGPAAHREAFLTTLSSLCEGGIYDHLGGGLHRYSVDARWLVPHFEKMLYDNAQFLRHLLWGWRATGQDLYRRRIEETVGWLAREMVVEGGGLAASLDADSPDEDGHPEEGAFYVWAPTAIDAALGERAADFRRRYDAGPRGNWEGRIVLNRLGGTGPAEAFHDEERGILLALRQARVRPGRDDKVLADWNGMAIRALAEIAHVLEHDAARVLAVNAYRFVMRALWRDGRLHHAAREGRVAGLASTADYGAMIAAASQLFALTLDARYLADAKRLAEAAERWHADGTGGHWMTAEDAGDVLIRLRGDGDEAVPSPTAQLLEGLALLAQISGEAAEIERAGRAMETAAGRIAANPAAYPGILSALHRRDHAGELAILGDARGDLVTQANRMVDLSRLDFTADDPARLPGVLSSVDPGRRPAAYLCAGQSCRPPVFDARVLEALLAGA